MKKIIGMIAFFLIFSAGLFSYEYILDKNPRRTYDLMTFVGTTRITTLTGGNWDIGYFDMALPSDNQFYFYGKRVTHLRITTKGYVIPGFGTPAGNVIAANLPIPDTDPPHPIIAVLWDDWFLVNAGEIWYEVVNAPPYSYVVIEWRGVEKFNHAGSSYDFSVAIGGNAYPGFANSIIFQYNDVEEGVPDTDYGASATVGIEHYTGAQGEEYSYDTVSLANGDEILLTPFVPIYDMTDGWGDGLPDPVVFRQSDGQGYFYCRKNDNPAAQELYIWGASNDIPLPGDYDGNGAIDVGVYRPSSSMWYTWGGSANFTIQWGRAGDIPVPADYDGDGDTDIAVFRPELGIWYIYYLPTGTTSSAQWGWGGDIPVPADYDNDGQADLAVFRPSNNTWYIRKSSNPAQSYIFTWGTEGDIPMPANFQSIWYSTACVYRPSTGQWFSYDQTSAVALDGGSWGLESDIPVPNDWDGDGLSDKCVFRPIGGLWYSTAGGGTIFAWGWFGDKPRCRRSRLVVAPSPLTETAAISGMGRPLNKD